MNRFPRCFADCTNTTCLVTATGLGIGFVRWAPGTFGSLLGILLAWGLSLLPPAIGVIGTIVLILIGIPICDRAAKLLGIPDPGSIVFDEIAAIPLIFWFASFTLSTAVAGFLLFRLFDISKLWPSSRLERLPGGLGIMADDVAAAIYAGLALRLGVLLSGSRELDTFFFGM